MLHNYLTISLTYLGITRKKTLVDFKYFWDGKLISKVPSTTYSGLHIADIALNWSILAVYGIPTRNAISIK